MGEGADVNRLFPAAVLLLGAALLLGGCATPGTPSAGGQAAAAQPAAPEKVDNLKLSEFILGTGDKFEISVYRQADLTQSVKVDPSGRMMFPLIGDVQLSGKSVFALRDELRERLSLYVVNPQVVIRIVDLQSQKVLLLGEVEKPGIYLLTDASTISEAVALSGGLTDNANESAVILIHRVAGKQETVAVDVGKITEQEDQQADVRLAPGDIVYVPKRTIVSISTFMSHIAKILSPVVLLETGIVLWPALVNAISGNSSTAATYPPVVLP
jgi:polysaccharide export outer membrane protein